MAASVTDAELVVTARAGDRRAFSTLFERWFDRSYDVAWRIVRNRDTAAEVAQDTFLVAWQKLDTLRDPEAFGGWILRTARNRALNRLEREGRSLAFDTDDTVTMIDLDRSAVDVADEIVRREQHDLVWAAAAALGERDASVLDLHLRHDLDPGQIAELLHITPNAAHQTLFRLRKRLEGAIRSYVLWNDGRPQCGELVELLEAEGVASFGPSAVKVISRHVTECSLCDERHASVLAPASMFAAVPLVVVGMDVRKAAAAELASQGVPIAPELIGSGAGGSGGRDDRGSGWRPSGARRSAIVGLAAVLLLLAGVVAAGLLHDDGPVEADLALAPGSTDTTAPPGSTTAPSTTPSTELPTSSVDTADEVAEVDGLTEETPRTTLPPATQPPVDRPPDTVPPVDPGTVPTEPESTTTSSSTTSSTEPLVAPTIVRFTAVNTGQPCTRVQPLSRRYRIIWLTDGATEVRLGGSLEVSPGPYPVSGEAEGCLPPRSSGTWTVTATNAGGSVTATVSVP
jgi:RNA polymerase sigma factor (sigma-70 family)